MLAGDNIVLTWGGDSPGQNADDADETGLEDAASSTASLSSSVMNYRTVQGRTYHSDRGKAEYW